MRCPFCDRRMDVRGSFRMCLRCGVEQGLEQGRRRGDPWGWWTWTYERKGKWRAAARIGFPGWREVPDGALLVAGREEDSE